MKKTLLAITVAALSVSTNAATNGAITGKISTLGLGIEYTFPVNHQFDLGFNANYFNYSKTFDEDDLTLDAKARLFTFGAVGYYYPMDNGFNINGGLYYNGNKVTFKATPKGNNTYTINDTTYSGAQIEDVEGSIDLNKIVPYLGVGWKSGDRSQAGFSFDANLGVMFHGTPSVDFSAKCNAGNPAVCDKLMNDIEAERKEFQDDADAFKFYPVAAIGFTYRF